MEEIEGNMVQQQIISKVLQTADFNIIKKNLLTEDYFIEYQDEFKFIKEHIEKYGNVPDKETFLLKFPEFDILEVNESDRYLVETIREEYNYAQSVPVVQTFAKLLQSDANEAIEYMQEQVKRLKPDYYIGGVDIIHQTDERYNEIKRRRENPKEWYFESGFPELDEILDGIRRGEEFIAIFARLGNGKSWVLLKMCAHVWKTGFNVGFVSPEMSAVNVGLRFDTLIKNFANKELSRGEYSDGYSDHLSELNTHTNKFVVSTPEDFGRKITVSKIRNWVEQNDIHLLAIDGIKYLTDERGRKGDNLTTSLTNISEDLMELSLELKIPVIVVVQANRGGVSGADDDSMPEIENIRDSDGIAHNATRVISLKQKSGDILEMAVKKNRYGKVGDRLTYKWSINIGEFVYLDSPSPSPRRSNDSGESGSRQAPKRVF